MVHERPPLQLEDVPGMVLAWVQDAGTFAAVGLALVVIALLVQRRGALFSRTEPLWYQGLLGFLGCVTAGAFLLHALQKGMGGKAASGGAAALGPHPFLTLGGAAALLAVGLPFVLHLIQLRPRRILALADLSMREAIRSKVLWIFTALALVFLFADWFLPHKPESQLQTYVQVMYWAMTPLLLVPAVVLGAFAIPRDLREQTIYTVITKPVERFEIFLGRFLGYTALLTLVLLALTGVSLIYVGLHGVHPAAVQQTYRARVPIYGNLEFRGRAPESTGIQMREWAYRRYIPGGPTSSARAVWQFAELPTRLNERRTVPCEFRFDIVRMTKGEEGRGVFCTLTFETWHWTPDRKPLYERELAQRLQRASASRAAILDQLAEEFGYYEHPSQEVFDQMTYAIEVPISIFRKAESGYAQFQQECARRGQKPPSPLTVTVKCEDPSQFLGMAKYDLYLVDDEGWFGWNFFKGALGLWFRLCLVIGVAVALSTYLSGVVGLMATLFLYGGGLLRDYIQSIAAGTAEGGGPALAAYRIAMRQPLMAPVDKTVTTDLAKWFDDAFQWLMRQLLAVLPDVDRFDLANYVAEGFNISGTTLSLCLLQLVGYLLPWVVLGYYLLRSREIAS